MPTLTIDPVTRIEGHSKITIQVGNDGEVQDAHFHVTQLRGFEMFCEGRPFEEMPALMARICGICPVSHLITAAKACDSIMSVTIPETAEKLRRVMNLAQIVQSHALSFFHLSSPDFLLGMDADPAIRNLAGLAAENPKLARDGIRMRQFGQQIIQWLGGKRVHPGWIVPGGVSEPLTVERRDQILATIPEAIAITLGSLQWFKAQLEDFREEIRTFANFPSLFLGLAKEDGGLALYKGWIRVVDSTGETVADHINPLSYQEFIGEAGEPASYLKSTYYKPLGYPEGMYRVGPLARLNLAKRCGTPLADAELAEFRELERHTVLSSFYYHYARLIEMLFAVERIQHLLSEAAILSKHVRAHARANNPEGVGIMEAPRGTLIHHYKVNDEGLITQANLIIATGHNNLAMNRGVLQAARHFVRGDRIEEGMLNRVEAVIRAFDPCLSCSTHANGHLALHVELRSSEGALLDEKWSG